MTGYPIVDAGMRELYETGWMHNRIRMVVGSFLVKHLRINWVEGEKHFRNCLLDFNEANNVAQWQWVAGSALPLRISTRNVPSSRRVISELRSAMSSERRVSNS